MTTGPASLINGQVYNSASVKSDFTGGGVTSSIVMGTRVIPGKDNLGVISYRDWQGNWNELQVRANAELSVGQLIKRNPDGWISAQGNKSVDNNTGRVTNGLHLQGHQDRYVSVYHHEILGSHHKLVFRVANTGADGWFAFHNDGNAFANGAWHSSSDARMKTDITQIAGALDKLANIGGYTYLKQGVPEAGVIAQEVESVLPQSVTQTELKLNDGSVLKDARGININGVVALLVEALKEERAARETLESRLAALEGKILDQ